MKLSKIFFIIVTIVISSSAMAQRKSPAKTVEEKIEATKVTINYSSPSVRGREVFGGLEPWGKLWRAGANEATTIEFSTDVEIQGEVLAAGKYAFFVTPMQKGKWKLTFNTVHDQWGAYKHDPSKDAMVIEVMPKKIDHVESLTYGVKKTKIYMDWATTRVDFDVTTLYEAE